MIITQTPLRISFFGGGTDFPDFFLKEGGCVLTSAINRYIFVIIKQRFDDKIRIGYSKTELVENIDDLQHELVRECLRLAGVRKRVEIATMGDIPSSGSGMGSSSTVTVGVLNALYQYSEQPKDADTLARQACKIEIDVLKKPIGIQDQFIAAHGGLRFINFNRDGSVNVERLRLDDGLVRRFSENLMLFFTNRTRKAEAILSEQVKNMDVTHQVLKEMKQLAFTAKGCLTSGHFEDFGRLLDESWQLKKRLASKISDPHIDEMYQAARQAGALGGKIAGAGGGGFLLLYCPPNRQDHVRAALKNLPELPFSLEDEGTKVIFNRRVTNRNSMRGGLVECGVASV